MNSEYCVVDIEATGGNHKNGRIIEIGIVKIRNRTIVSEFSTLINPRQKIDRYVSKLTGITDLDLRDAPYFEDVMENIVDFLAESTFVGHNAAFDYTYLRTELRKYGVNYTANQLCTIDLSRILVPNEESYSLGKLCRSLELDVSDRHRALGDANSTALLLLRLMEESGYEQSVVASKRLAISPAKNSKGLVKMSPSVYTSLPDEPGIFFLKDKKGNDLYVGRGESIKLSASKIFSESKKYERFKQHQGKFHNIEYQLTGNELLAELVFYSKVYEKHPLLNIHVKQLEYRYSLNVYAKRGVLKLGITRVKDDFGIALSYFKDYKSAEKELKKLISELELQENQFEIKLSKVLKTQKRLTEEQLLKLCDGTVFEKIISKIENYQPQGVYVGHGRNAGESVFFEIKNDTSIGYGFFNGLFNVENASALLENRKELQIKDGAKICWHFINGTNQYQKVL